MASMASMTSTAKVASTANMLNMASMVNMASMANMTGGTALFQDRCSPGALPPARYSDTSGATTNRSRS